MRIGRRRVMAALALVAIVAVAVAAWVLWGTDGLLAVAFSATQLAILGIGWLIIRVERNLVRLVSETRNALEKAIAATSETGGQAEQLLRAVHAGFARSEHTLDTLVSEWRRTEEQLEAAVAELSMRPRGRKDAE
ncbi:MAG TPA: hypothetical protein VJ950_11550 [Acidimicrobiia bacterium]|nr:hypothetical protein [Acidimicrobiia bacterium]